MFVTFEIILSIHICWTDAFTIFSLSTLSSIAHKEGLLAVLAKPDSRDTASLSIHFIFLTIIVENVEHLARLSDEYEVKSIFESCVQFLKKQSIKKGNVMKILRLANLYELKVIRQNCYGLLMNMRLQPILEIIQQHDDVDKEDVQNILIKRIQYLESFLDSLYPHFIGMVECCFWLWHEGKQYMRWCPIHFDGGRSSKKIDERLQECSVCKEMLNTFKESHFYRLSFERYDYESLIDRSNLLEDLPNLILRMAANRVTRVSQTL